MSGSATRFTLGSKIRSAGEYPPFARYLPSLLCDAAKAEAARGRVRRHAVERDIGMRGVHDVPHLALDRVRGSWITPIPSVDLWLWPVFALLVYDLVY
jgi:hypothetical protein